VILSGTKALGREALRKGARIMADIAENQSSSSPLGIFSKHVNEKTKVLVNSLRGRGMKSKRKANISFRKDRKKRKKNTNI
jgi:hypothetical protein